MSVQKKYDKEVLFWHINMRAGPEKMNVTKSKTNT